MIEPERMSRIRILPDRVANQIAAGEVIERPVAVVKELVENSLDAGATRIEVEFRGGGKRLIRVEDNGEGMLPDEALLSLERHATSKIREAADLDRVQSFGFRGEALPSIASVSQFTMRSRPPGETVGCEVRVNGGKLISRKECGMPPGTQIEVEHLFHPVPARRKFLKTDQTESAHIIQMMRWLSVAHAGVAFTLLENGRVLFQTPPCNSMRERVEEIWGRGVTDHLLDFSHEGEGLTVHGLVGEPGFSRSTRQEMVCLVNQRPVESRTLNYAIIEAYHTSIPKGRYPVVFLLFTLDPARIDVNVHPAKREIRFREESRIRHAVVSSLLERLRREKEQRMRGDLHALEAGTPPPSGTPPEAEISKIPEAKPESGNAERDAAFQPRKEVPRAPQVAPARATQHSGRPATPARADGGESSRGFRLNWSYLGKMVHGLVLFETGKGLVLLDPVAARNRIRYETVQEHFQAEVAASQSLLLPITLDLEPVSASTLEESLDFLNRNGFAIEPFGRNFFRATALPPWLEPGEGEGYIRDLIDQVRQQGLRLDLESPELAHEALARLAARRQAPGAARERNAGDYLQLAEALLRCRDPFTDPGGRSTFVELSRGELDRRFGR